MTNIAQALKAEVSRISRKETKAAIKEISKSNMALKKAVADLKRRLILLEKDNKRLMNVRAKRQDIIPPAQTEEGKRARLTSKGVRALRKKLGLTRPEFAKLCGTSAQTVAMWETKEGLLRLRPHTKGAVLSLRGIGLREAKRRLAECQEEAKKPRTLGKRIAALGVL